VSFFSLTDQIAFVTGAGSGIGQRIATALAQAGADVAGFDLPGAAGLEATVDQIRSTRSVDRSIVGAAEFVDRFGKKTLSDKNTPGPFLLRRIRARKRSEQLFGNEQAQGIVSGVRACSHSNRRRLNPFRRESCYRRLKMA